MMLNPMPVLTLVSSGSIWATGSRSVCFRKLEIALNLDHPRGSMILERGFSNPSLMPMMVKDTSTSRATREIAELAKIASLTQAELAARLGITQSYLCKLLKGSHIASARVQERVQEMLRMRGDTITDPWIERVGRAAKSSRDFRAAIDVLLRIIHKNS
ncbi:helix-turn-helix transcriptional regulator [Bradyrhizobium sp. LA2.1]|uniref:helix-turn-helix domain-containing protein n=1 Tax=Bradyrhizobium sp. LA2.1 TaxID=3156376 RepID=UPI003390E8DB